MVLNLSSLKLDDLDSTEEISIKKTSKNDIAIIGIAGQFPMADNIVEFWKNLKEGRDCVSPISSNRLEDIDSYLRYKNIDKSNMKIGERGYLKEIDKFDYRFFRLSRNEALLMDPSQRLFLEIAWHALEDAGYCSEKIMSSKTGVYVGYSRNIIDSYERIIYDVRPDLFQSLPTANLASILPSRISYLLDLKGPTMVIDTACSSSLVAVHLACQGIRMANCDMAIAGGVKLGLLPLDKVGEKVGIESTDYRTRTFDDSSSGTGAGEGIAAIILKPLERALRDRDNIYAVIKGSSINQDGASMSITAPNPLAQADVIDQAWKDAGINPQHITYIEAHGTATNLGDPVEIQGISNAFERYTNKKQFCAIGSVKSNIGHLDASAGIASIVKMVMALKYKKLPPTIHFNRPNRNIKFHDSPVYINENLQDWETEGYQRLCGISSFAMSGTNCHVVLEEASASKAIERDERIHLLTISAKSKDALWELIELYHSYLELNPDVNLQDVCYTANTGRGHYSYRLAIIAENSAKMKDKLSRLRNVSFEEFLEDGVFYGFNNNEKNEVESESYIEKIALLQEVMGEEPKKLIKDSEYGRELLYEICHLYVKGAAPQWEKLYYNKECFKLSLPLYPFQRERCWIEIPKNIVSSDKPQYLQSYEDAKVELKGREDGTYSVTEKEVAQVWSNVLGFPKIDIDDNYYDLGGDSILSMRIMNRINKKLGLNIPIADLYKHLSIRELGGYIDSIYKAKDKYISLQKAQKKDYYELSSAQKRLFILDRLESGNSYNIPHVCLIRGKVERQRLEETIKKLIQRHESLRTSFQIIDGEPVQIVHEQLDFTLQYEETSEDNIKTLINEFQSPFDISKAPLLRAKLVKVWDEKYIFIYDIHHIICDGISMIIFTNEFEALYNGKTIPELTIQYKDFSEWQNNSLKLEYINKQKEYWKNVFLGEIPVLNMPTDYIRPSRQSFEGDRIETQIDKVLQDELNNLALKTGSTLYMVLLAAFYVLLNKYTDQEDIIIGSPIAGRSHEDFENIIGMFANTLAFRNYPTEEKTFSKFLHEVKESALNAYANQDFQFEDLISFLEIPRDMSRNPLFDVMFVMHVADISTIDIGGLKFEDYGYKNKSSKFDLTLNAIEKDGRLSLILEYCTSLFKVETVQRMIVYYINILKEIVKNPYIKISEIQISTQMERKQLLIDFNKTQAPYPQDILIHEIFEQRVKSSPEKIALVFGDKSMTYGELNNKANQIARVLVCKGVKAEELVAIMVERSFEMIIGILAILKAGGAYLPIDPNYPKDRIRYMLEDSDARVLIIQKHLAKYAQGFELEVVDLDNEDIYKGDGSNLGRRNSSSSLAYVIYTSGSTGKPKGVMVEHKSVVNVLSALQKQYAIMEDDAYLLKTSYTFDVSVAELFGWFMCDGRLIILPSGEEKNPNSVLEFIKDFGVTHINFVPTMLEQILNTIQMEKISCIGRLKYVFSAGEAISRATVNRFYTYIKNVRLENLYGPTEATIYATGSSLSKKERDDNGNVTIGKPLQNVKIYILNDRMELQPLGFVGEIYIAGYGIARGYLNRPELTRERFLDNPLVPGEIVYKTGDLARLREDGNIEYLGRKDQQIKIRGFRIELGEIESQLLKHNAIKEAVVIDKEDKNGSKVLCAYIVSDEKLTVEVIRSFLSRSLPEYMIPFHFTQLKSLPLSLSGKINRLVLKDIDERMSTGIKYIAPRNDKEKILSTVWQEVLGASSVGIDDNFFGMGGDSIKALQVMARLQKYQQHIEFKKIFQNPTIRKLSSYLKEKRRKTNFELIQGKVPLTPIQQWFFQQDFESDNYWNQAVMLYRKDGFDDLIVDRVFRKITQHHDALRMSFNFENGFVEQFNRGLDEKSFTIKVFDFTDAPDFEALIAKETDMIQKSMDLSKDSLVKLVIFKTLEGDHLLIAIHHLVVDGVSWRIILEDFATGYMHEQKGNSIILQGKTDSYKLWSDKLRNYAESKALGKEIEYWLNLENTEINVLPKDYEASESMIKDTQSISLTISKKYTDKLLKSANRAYNTETKDILLITLALAVKQWIGQNRVAVNIEGHGREDILEDLDISRTVGWFTAIYPIILNIDSSWDISLQIKNIKESLRRIPNKGIGYGILKYLTLKDDKRKFNLKPEISFNYLGQFDQDIDSNVFAISPYSVGNLINPNFERLHSLDIVGLIMDGKMTLNFDYSVKQYKKESISRFVEIYKKNLESIIDYCIEKEKTEFTPSDFGEYDLEIEEFENILKSSEKKVEKIYPLTPMQEEILKASKESNDEGTYFVQQSISVHGEFDVEIFAQSFSQLIQNHDIFRTIFVYEEIRDSRQVVLSEGVPEIYYEDISHYEDSFKSQYIQDIEKRDREKGFDLRGSMLTRLSILKIGLDKFRLIWSFHHIIIDGWCFDIIAREVFNTYSMLKSGKGQAYSEVQSYSDYIRWLKKQDKEKALSYWKEYLKEYEGKAILPVKDKLEKREGFEYREFYFDISEALISRLKETAIKEGITINTVFQTLWGIMLMGYNKRLDVVFGSIVSGRTSEVSNVESIIGLFISVIPVRISSKRNVSFLEVAKKVQSNMIDSDKYNYLSIDEIKQVSVSNIVDHVIFFENYPFDESMINSKDDLSFELKEMRVFEQTGFDLNVVVMPGEAFKIKLTYNGALYDESLMKQIRDNILKQVLMVSNSLDIKIEKMLEL